MEKLVPMGERLVLRPIKQGERVLEESGIIIPESATAKPQVADVVAIGDEVKKIKTGDKVMYAFYAGQVIILGRVEFIVLSEDDVLCRVDEDGT